MCKGTKKSPKLQILWRKILQTTFSCLFLCSTLNYFEAHATVMIGAFPETGFVVDGVQTTVWMPAPIPLTIVPIHEFVLNKLPTFFRLFKSFFIA